MDHKTHDLVRACEDAGLSTKHLQVQHQGHVRGVRVRSVRSDRSHGSLVISGEHSVIQQTSNSINRQTLHTTVLSDTSMESVMYPSGSNHVTQKC